MHLWFLALSVTWHHSNRLSVSLLWGKHVWVHKHFYFVKSLWRCLLSLRYSLNKTYYGIHRPVWKCLFWLYKAKTTVILVFVVNFSWMSLTVVWDLKNVSLGFFWHTTSYFVSLDSIRGLPSTNSLLVHVITLCRLKTHGSMKQHG